MARIELVPDPNSRAARRRLLRRLALACVVAASAGVGSSCGGGGGTTVTPTPTPVTPTVTAISPSSGANLGSTAVTITGTNFAAGATVTIGGSAATNVVVAGATTLSAVTSAHGTGTADVVVTVNGASGSLPNGFTYVAVAPNTAPVIASLTAQGTRANEPASFADNNEEIVLTATVTDAETPVNQLTYEWSCDLGSMTAATGATARWRAPVTIGAPVNATVTLKVTEVIATARGTQPVITQNTIGTATVSVHNSTKEAGDYAKQFLLDFSNSALSPEYVVRDFYDGCPGKAAELDDVRNNRDNYYIRSYSVADPSSVTVNFKSSFPLPNHYPTRSGDGLVIVQCEWHDTYKPSGAQGTTIGPDYVTVVYRNNRWWLCNSDFPAGTHTNNPLLPVFIR
jgi:hypothetical protein